jgi:hypothetical protein
MQAHLYPHNYARISILHSVSLSLFGGPTLLPSR